MSGSRGRAMVLVAGGLLAVTLIAMVVLMERAGASTAPVQAPAGLRWLLGVLPAVSAVMGLAGAWGLRGSGATAWWVAAGSALVLAGWASFLVFNEPTAINVFGFLAVVVGALALLVGCALAVMTPDRRPAR